MKLRVKETNGRLHTVEADPHTSFDRFRELVHKVVPGIAPDAQKLVFNGRLLEAVTLKANGVKDGGARAPPPPILLPLHSAEFFSPLLGVRSCHGPSRHLGTS
jgi:hypothetical protein